MSAIGPGDLVRQIGSCCVRTARTVGFIFVADKVEHVECFCSRCGAASNELSVIVTFTDGKPCGAPLSWRKKIEPPPIAKTVEQREKALA